MVTKNWTKIYEHYGGLWVALMQDEITVVGSGETLKEAVEKANSKGYLNPILTRIPKTLSAYVGGAL